MVYMLLNRFKYITLYYIVFLAALSVAASEVILVSPRLINNVQPPVLLSWNLQNSGNEVSMVRVEVYKSNQYGDLLGAPVWATNIFNVWQNNVFVDYSVWEPCQQYAWQVVLYRVANNNSEGEFHVNNIRYARVKLPLPTYFSMACQLEEHEDKESTGYFDFPNEETPFVFHQKWGLDIKFHYFSPYENDRIVCKVYNWAREELATTEFSLKKGSNYLKWDDLFDELEQEVSVSEVLFLEVINEKDLRRTLKFMWIND